MVDSPILFFLLYRCKGNIFLVNPNLLTKI
nr:MAG TPA: hypothetical protein [Caudoviricetes sp.]